MSRAGIHLEVNPRRGRRGGVGVGGVVEVGLFRAGFLLKPLFHVKKKQVCQMSAHVTQLIIECHAHIPYVKPVEDETRHTLIGVLDLQPEGFGFFQYIESNALLITMEMSVNADCCTEYSFSFVKVVTGP